MLIGGGNDVASVAAPRRSRIERAMRLEWLGQTAASVCWLASMQAYGIRSTGDWLQVLAATGWLVANIAAIANAESE